VSDYTISKPGMGAQFPAGAVASSWGRLEPLITPEQLVNRQLFGIPLVSGTKDPDTGVADRLTQDMLQDEIDRAVSEVELMTHTDLMPTQIQERHPWDPQEMKSLGYLRLRHRPVASIESVAIATTDGTPIFTFDLNWIETGNLDQGQLNIMPLLLMLGQNGGTTAIAGTAATSAYLSLFGGNSRWAAALLTIVYTVGFEDGLLPKVLNDLVGITAAMAILSFLAPTYGKSNSSSLSLDGMSQSISGNGPEIFTKRMADLEKMQAMLVKKIKAKAGQSIFTGNV